MQADSSIRFDQGDEAESSSHHQQPASALLQRASPLGDATNRVSISSAGRWPQYSSAPYSSSPTSKQKAHRPRSGSQAAADENTAPDAGLQQQDDAAAAVAAASKTHQQQLYQEAMQLQDLASQQLQQQQQQQDSKHLIDVQRRMEELQQRARQLEAENEQLKSAQAAATAQIDSLKLMQQAEQLKQVGACWPGANAWRLCFWCSLMLAHCDQLATCSRASTYAPYRSCSLSPCQLTDILACFAGTHGVPCSKGTVTSKLRSTSRQQQPTAEHWRWGLRMPASQQCCCATGRHHSMQQGNTWMLLLTAAWRIS
jgi:hypothetical protein